MARRSIVHSAVGRVAGIARGKGDQQGHRQFRRDETDAPITHANIRPLRVKAVNPLDVGPIHRIGASQAADDNTPLKPCGTVTD